MNFKKFFLTMMVVLLSATAYAETSTIAFAVSPQMTCSNCEKKIKSNLRFEKGVKSIETSLKDKKVTVTYNPGKTSPEALTAAFKKIGYTATVLPATLTPAKSTKETKKK